MESSTVTTSCSKCTTFNTKLVAVEIRNHELSEILSKPAVQVVNADLRILTEGYNFLNTKLATVEKRNRELSELLSKADVQIANDELRILIAGYDSAQLTKKLKTVSAKLKMVSAKLKTVEYHKPANASCNEPKRDKEELNVANGPKHSRELRKQKFLLSQVFHANEE